MIPPSYRPDNVPQGRVKSQTRAARAARAAYMEKIYEIPRATTVRARCSSSLLVPVKCKVHQRLSLRRTYGCYNSKLRSGILNNFTRNIVEPLHQTGWKWTKIAESTERNKKKSKKKLVQVWKIKIFD